MSFHFKSRLTEVISWIGKHEFSTLLSIILIAAGLWAFTEIADEVFEGDSESLDRTILMSIRSADDLSDPVGPRWIEEMGRDFTALGGIGVLSFITIAVSGYLLLQRNARAALFLLFAVSGGFVVSMMLKIWFARPRPDLVPHGSYIYTASFPSGHAMMAAATYLTLGAILARLHVRFRLKAYFLILAVILSVCVGASRVYLGVHWPTDVFAGWTLGASWAMLCWLTALRMQRWGKMEEEPIS
jgi:undecaprenyl-diphosphatase